jgi:phage protein D
MKTQLLFLALLGCAIAPLTACERKSGYVDAKGSNYYTRTDYTYDQREEFRAEMQSASDKIEKRLTELKDDIARGSRAAKAETQQAIVDLENGLASLRKDLAGSGSTMREGWDDFKRKVSNSVDDLGRRVDRAFSS